MFGSLLKWKKDDREVARTPRSRSLRLETLENRELLSVAPWDAPAFPDAPTLSVAAVDSLPVVDLSALTAESAEPVSNATVETIVVTSTADSGPGSLRFAVENASNGAIITFDSSLKGETITLGSTINITQSAGLTIDASPLYDGVPGITINANGNRAFNITGATAMDSLVTIQGLEISNAYVDGAGAGIYLASGSTASFADLTVKACRVSAYSSSGGGSIYVGGEATLNNCSFIDNVTYAQNVGALYVAGKATVVDSTFSSNTTGVSVMGSATFENCAFSGNSYYGVDGRGTKTLTDCVVSNNGSSGIYSDSGTLTLTDSEVSGNKGRGVSVSGGTATIENVDFASNAGGVRANGTTTIRNSTFTNHKLASDAGGAIYVYSGSATVENSTFDESSATNGGTFYLSSGSLNVANSTIANSEATTNGGAVYASDGSLQLSNVRIEHTVAKEGSGGAIYVGSGVDSTTLSRVYVADATSALDGGALYLGSTASSTISNSAFLDSTSSQYGGGAYVGAGTATFSNVTLAGNEAAWYGGGIYAYGGSATFYNSVIACNAGVYGGADVQVRTDASVSADRTLSSFSGWANASSSGVTNYGYSATQPLFANASTGDYALAQNSQAIDRGVASRVVGQTDLDGRVRVYGTAVDLGAYEYGAKTQLATPTLDAVAQDAYSIALTIGAVDSATRYLVQYTSQDASFAADATVSFYVSGGKRILDNLNPSTRYWARVKAVGAGDYVDSDWATVTLRTPASNVDPTPLAVPTISVVANGSNALTATIGAVDAASSYVLRYSTDETLWTTVAVPQSGATVIDDLVGGTTYYVQVKAVGTGRYGDSEWSASSVATTETAPDALETPTLSVATRGTSGLTLTIGYVGGATSYEVEYSTDPTFETSVLTRAFSSSGEKKLSALSPNSTYYVRVKAVAAGTYADSAWANGSAATAAIRCAAPTFEVAKRDATSYTLTIGYVSGATSYAVEYSTDPNFATSSERVFTSSGAKKFSGFDATQTTYVRVKAVGTGAYVDSSYSASTLVLGAPNLEATPRDTSSLALALDYVAGATEYVVEYSTDSSFTTFETKVYTSSGAKKLSGLEVGTTYYFRTAARGAGAVDSLYSAVCSAQTEAYVLNAPTFTAKASDASTLSLSIGYVSGASAYVVEYSADPTFATSSKKTFTSSGAKKISFAAPNTLYYVRVMADGDGGYVDSAWSETKTTKTYAIRLTAPTLTASARDDVSLSISIGYVSGASSYTVEYATDDTFTMFWTRTFSSSGAKKIVDLDPSGDYYFRVKADGVGGYADSGWSSVARARTSEPVSSALLTDEVFASPFDDFDFFAEDDEDDFGLF